MEHYLHSPYIFMARCLRYRNSFVFYLLHTNIIHTHSNLNLMNLNRSTNHIVRSLRFVSVYFVKSLSKKLIPKRSNNSLLCRRVIQQLWSPPRFLSQR
jgi:hypothetical protein